MHVCLLTHGPLVPLRHKTTMCNQQEIIVFPNLIYTSITSLVMPPIALVIFYIHDFEHNLFALVLSCFYTFAIVTSYKLHSNCNYQQNNWDTKCPLLNIDICAVSTSVLLSIIWAFYVKCYPYIVIGLAIHSIVSHIILRKLWIKSKNVNDLRNCALFHCVTLHIIPCFLFHCTVLMCIHDVCNVRSIKK